MYTIRPSIHPQRDIRVGGGNDNDYRKTIIEAHIHMLSNLPAGGWGILLRLNGERFISPPRVVGVISNIKSLPTEIRESSIAAICQSGDKRPV